MIIEEFLKIENHTDKDEIGMLMNDLYNEFRGGRDRNDILILLNSDIDYMRYYGCSILNEICINDIKYIKKIMDKLYDILINDISVNNNIRAYHALYGIYLDNKDINGLLLLCEEMKNNTEPMIKQGSIEFLEKYKTAPENYTFDEFTKHLFSR
ncbi:hypothetical protein [Chryseobacterium limigenitum]|uniref:Immunity protein 30 n=1 Tax=Chryseobacterium limigenitum TaxID=1612149 RepID=A0A1K2IR60_9FLAO|nr:hypothetical protein [Chryseobacterium limigenitum]SFZ94929.1 hypothetical protein SAMN05216324_10844 [Chryseobacterium limigenitum]